MSLQCHGEENHEDGPNIRSDVKSFSLQHSASFTAMFASSESDALGPPADISLSSTLPVTASSNPSAKLPRFPSSGAVGDVALQSCPSRSCQARRSGWQSQAVSISTFVRRFPELEVLGHASNRSERSANMWNDLPQIEKMVCAGYSRPPVCQPGDLNVGKLLGCGGQAQIHEGVLTSEAGTATPVVVKEFIGEHGDDEMTAEEVDTELSACWVLRGHHHIAPVLGVIECAVGGAPLACLLANGAGPEPQPAPPSTAAAQQTVRALVMQRFSGSLQRTLEVLRASSDPGRRTLSTETLLRVIAALANALACAHRRGMLHMDVKPANVLVQETAPGVLAHPHPQQVGPVVLTDFGTSILPWDPRAVHGLCGTLDYHPPELALTDMKFAAELVNPGDDGSAPACAALPSPDSSSSNVLLGMVSMDAPALQRAASALFDEKMDVWGLGILMYECLAEHLPLESVSDPHIILSRVATGTGMASAAPTFALLPCHKAVLALCQWVTAPRPGDRPSARQLHAAAAEMLVDLRQHAAGLQISEGACDGDAGEVIACGEVLTLGRATRAHAPAAAGWTDSLVAAAPLARPGEVVVHPLVGIVNFGCARPSPEPFAGPLPADIARKAAALAESAGEADGEDSGDGDEFVDAPEEGDCSVEEYGSPSSTYEAGSHAVFDDDIDPLTPRPRKLFGSLIDTLLLAGAGFGYGGAVDAAAAPCNSCDDVKRVRGSAAWSGSSGESGTKRANSPVAASLMMDSPRIGAGISGVAAHGGVACSPPCTLVGVEARSTVRAMPPPRCSSPPPVLSPAPVLSPCVSAPLPLCAADELAAVGAATGCAAAYAQPAFMPTLTAIPSITDSVGTSLDATCGSSRSSPMKAADCVAHDIMETTTSFGSSDDSDFEDGLCVRAVIGHSPGGFPGPATSPGLPLTCSQRKPAAGSIFFIPSPRTKFGDLTGTPDHPLRAVAGPPSADGTPPTPAAPSSCGGPCALAVAAGPSSQASTSASSVQEYPVSRRRLDFVGLGTVSTDESSFMRVDSSRCPFAAFGSLGIQDVRREAEAGGAAAVSLERQLDVFRQPTSTVMNLVGRRHQQQAVPELIASPRDLIMSPRDVIVSPRGAVIGRQRSPGCTGYASDAATAESEAHAARITSRLSPRRLALVRRMCSIVPRLSISNDGKAAPGAAHDSTAPALGGQLALQHGSSPSASLADTVSLGEGAGSESGTDCQHSSPISAQGTPRWRAAAAQVRSRGQGALAAGREKVALGREKGRMLLASVSGAGGAMSVFKRMKSAVARSTGAKAEAEGGNAQSRAHGQPGSRRRFLDRWGRSQQV